MPIVNRDETLLVTFQPEAWIHDNAVSVDPEGPTTWHPSTEFIKTIIDSYGQPYFDLMFERGDYDDVLVNDPAAPQWVQDWDGPFTTRIEHSEEG